MVRTLIAIAANWAACAWIGYWLNRADPWLHFALFNAIACTIITIRPAGRMQSAIGGVYVASLFCHAAYGVNGEVNTDYYLHMLDTLRIFQLLLVGAWVGGGIVESVNHRWLRLRNPLAARPRLARMD